MTKQKITKKKQPRSIGLGRGNYMKAPNTTYTLQSLLKQNSIQKIAAATYKFYKTS